MASKLTAHIQNGKQVLPPLESICRLSPAVVRILAQNPGPYTLQGTCTYLVGKGNTRFLVDTGSGGHNYISFLQKALEQEACSLEGIVVTHWHHDHIGGIPEIQNTFGAIKAIPVYKYMPSEAVKLEGKGEASIDPYAIWPKEKVCVVFARPSLHKYVRAKYIPLQDGQALVVEGATLRVHFTPGHANDHVVLVLEEEGNMFSGDNVLGIGTGVFRDLARYLSSLEKMKALKPPSLYPGHGPVVENGVERIQDYIDHRKQRLEQVSKVLESDKTKAWSLREITDVVYPGLEEKLKAPAMSNSLKVLQALLSQGKVLQEGEAWTYIQSTGSSSM